jgi:hypothetical protein
MLKLTVTHVICALKRRDKSLIFAPAPVVVRIRDALLDFNVL